MDSDTSTTQPAIRRTTSTLTRADRIDHVLTRFAYRRGNHRVEPGLYAIGSPAPDSPVFVTANYRLSFDALRSSLPRIDGYILVLDTFGINVWCAAGKGTFGTDELVRRIAATGLADVVSHRVLILPQLGAPGVSARAVKELSGFRVEYGPVRAADLPEYLRTRRATTEMRRVRFTLADRLTLVPVELVAVWIPLLVLAILAVLTGGAATFVGAIAAIFAGVAVFPALLPWLPTRDFSSKGFALGLLVALPFVLAEIFGQTGHSPILQAAWSLSYLLALPPVTAYLALNFTGATTFTSRSGVEREIATYIRPMAATFAVGVVLSVGLLASQLVTLFTS